MPYLTRDPARLITGIAVVLAILVTLTLPLGYFLSAQRNLRTEIQGHATLLSRTVSRLVVEQPRGWKYLSHMEELLRRDLSFVDIDKGGVAILLETDAAVIARTGSSPSPPAIHADAPVFDAGVQVAAMRVEHTLRPLLLETALAAALGLFFGMAIFVALRVLPLRALRRTLDALHAAHEETQTQAIKLERHAHEEEYRGLVEQSIAGIYIVQDDKLAYVNKRFAEIFGYESADEIIGRDSISLVSESDRSVVQGIMRQRQESGARSVSYAFTGTRKDGSMVDVGVHSTIATHRGRAAFIGLAQDISEKKRAEEEIQRYVEQLKTAFMSSVEVATIISEMRDPYTAGHERRVAKLAVAIGAELGFDAHRQEGLQVAGSLHDVGKITIPPEILSKPGKITALEFQIIQEHPQSGYDILKGVKFPWPVAEVALQHHERIDGSGYPQGLKGEAILLEARIMAVADVVEAMSSHRPYRPGLGIDKALAEIERGRATAYDAGVADACLRLFREKRFAFEKS